MKEIKRILDLNVIRELDLNNSNLRNFIPHPTKKYLNLESDPMMTSFFSNNYSLSSLVLSNSRLDDERGNIILTSLANNSSQRITLARLNFKGNKLGEKSAKAILLLL